MPQRVPLRLYLPAITYIFPRLCQTPDEMMPADDYVGRDRHVRLLAGRPQAAPAGHQEPTRGCHIMSRFRLCRMMD